MTSGPLVRITSAQLEAAAIALHDSRYGLGAWEVQSSADDYATVAEIYRDEARIVLRASLGDRVRFE